MFPPGLARFRLRADEMVSGPALDRVQPGLPVPESELHLMPYVPRVEERRGVHAGRALVVPEATSPVTVAPDAVDVQIRLLVETAVGKGRREAFT